jgi:hypothetical protein
MNTIEQKRVSSILINKYNLDLVFFLDGNEINGMTSNLLNNLPSKVNWLVINPTLSIGMTVEIDSEKEVEIRQIINEHFFCKEEIDEEIVKFKDFIKEKSEVLNQTTLESLDLPGKITPILKGIGIKTVFDVLNSICVEKKKYQLLTMPQGFKDVSMIKVIEAIKRNNLFPPTSKYDLKEIKGLKDYIKNNRDLLLNTRVDSLNFGLTIWHPFGISYTNLYQVLNDLRTHNGEYILITLPQAVHKNQMEKYVKVIKESGFWPA